MTNDSEQPTINLCDHFRTQAEIDAAERKPLQTADPMDVQKAKEGIARLRVANAGKGGL